MAEKGWYINVITQLRLKFKLRIQNRLRIMIERIDYYIIPFPCCWNLVLLYKGKGPDVWPSMMSHTQNLSHLRAHTHTQPFFAAAPREQLEVRCLAQGSHHSLGIKGGRKRCTFTHPTYKPCWYLDSNPLPLGYKSNSNH